MALSLVPFNNLHMDRSSLDLSLSFFHELEAYLQGQSAATKVAHRILAFFYQHVETLVLEGETPDSVEAPLETLWMTILATATQIPHDHPYLQRLVELLLALKTQPAPAPPDISTSARALLEGFEEEWGQHFWDNLPVFGMSIHNTDTRNPADADQVMELEGQIMQSNLGEEPYSSDDWARLQKLRLLCTTMGVMNL